MSKQKKKKILSVSRFRIKILSKVDFPQKLLENELIQRQVLDITFVRRVLGKTTYAKGGKQRNASGSHHRQGLSQKPFALIPLLDEQRKRTSCCFSAQKKTKNSIHGKKENQRKTRDKNLILGAHKTLVSINLYTLLINSKNYLFFLSHYLSMDGFLLDN